MLVFNVNLMTPILLPRHVNLQDFVLNGTIESGTVLL